jgi:hypothetical protein
VFVVPLGNVAGLRNVPVSHLSLPRLQVAARIVRTIRPTRPGRPAGSRMAYVPKTPNRTGATLDVVFGFGAVQWRCVDVAMDLLRMEK